ncbi:YggS family pyridoxal phosphate-dependent enzyme [Treponema phagedenis]|uniref:YggS family pyridoxal phosphate-dependent enzyme n=1 Tax=Treponema phagedenis TaxID=162 RepID=UPI0001F637C4|nr:YggS family pyridoxal phosphate-dependent enzyme [Treponema phagedenis]EFW36877.1 pyridoxal phosphate enzyme, YggS family [Treponema phagedenis F0421]TYT78859.1 YggS family pyridoxal phosphate-dependent enzyme [Treponema phagedenis]
MNVIQQNIEEVKRRIAEACARAGRDPSEVKLLMATKTIAPDWILQAFECGELLIGENKVQELAEKYEALSAVPHRAHFIGHLQTNKIKDVIQYADCIESVDRFDLAEKLARRLRFEGKTIDVLIQVNTSAEETKSGCAPEEALSLIKQVSAFPDLRIKGLMTIGLFSSDTEKVRACYRLLKNIQEDCIKLALPNVEMAVLSMGMSGDFEIAIEEGSTEVRVGTSIFGERVYH